MKGPLRVSYGVFGFEVAQPTVAGKGELKLLRKFAGLDIFPLNSFSQNGVRLMATFQDSGHARKENVENKID